MTLVNYDSVHQIPKDHTIGHQGGERGVKKCLKVKMLYASDKKLEENELNFDVEVLL